MQFSLSELMPASEEKIAVIFLINFGAISLISILAFAATKIQTPLAIPSFKVACGFLLTNISSIAPEFGLYFSNIIETSS